MSLKVGRNPVYSPHCMGVHIKEKNHDLREMPAYGINEAAHYLGIPKATLRSWVLVRHYPTGAGRQFFRPIIELPDKDQRLLSFVNLVEVHVLDAIRRVHWKVRKAIDYLKRELGSNHPLAEQEFVTDRVDLFVGQDQLAIAIRSLQAG